MINYKKYGINNNNNNNNNKKKKENPVVEYK